MTLYQLTAEAEDDLFAIWAYIAQDSVQAADEVESDLYSAFSLLSGNPQIGHIRTDLTPLPVRFWTLPRYSNYIVVHDPAARSLCTILQHALSES